MKQAESPSNVKVRNVSASPSLISNAPEIIWGIWLSSQSSEPMYQASWPFGERVDDRRRAEEARERDEEETVPAEARVVNAVVFFNARSATLLWYTASQG